jgi:hypothetical protein
VDDEGGLGRRDDRLTFDQGDRHVLAEGGRLRVQPKRLVRGGRQVRRDAEAGPALHAAGQTDLALDGRSGVDDVDVDRHPGSGPGVAVEEHLRFHGQLGPRTCRQRAAQACKQDSQEQQDA